MFCRIFRSSVLGDVLRAGRLSDFLLARIFNHEWSKEMLSTITCW